MDAHQLCLLIVSAQFELSFMGFVKNKGNIDYYQTYS